MTSIQQLRVPALALALATSLQAGALHAQEARPQPEPTPHWELNLSPYALHFNPDENHKWVYLVGLERHRGDGWLWGAAAFSNSFGQPSATAYVAYQWERLFGVQQLYGKIAAGVMYGYVDEYEDKVPFNHNGWSPVLLPAVGWRFTPNDAAQLTLLGSAGLLFSYVRRF